MPDQDLSFHEKEALLYRLHEGLENSDKEVVFVVGAPLTAPVNGENGVADVKSVIDLIRSEFGNKPTQLSQLDKRLATSSNPYQTAFDFLSSRAGQDAANRIIKRAVAKALQAPPNDNRLELDIHKLSEDELHQLDQAPSAWHLSPAALSLGTLIAKHPDRFGKIIITSNFDPLIEVSVRNAGSAAWRTSLSVDGSIFQSSANGCQVIHIHGYWHGTDTLHTNRQLIMSRPTLKNDLLKLLQNKIVVVIAYGGWPDVFTGALGGVVSNENLFPEVLWAFHNERPILSDHLFDTLRPGIDRNRVTFYEGVDCHSFFPDLLHLWETNPDALIGGPGAPEQFSTPGRPATNRTKLFRLPPLECDRPPSVDIWVGRENELRSLETSPAKVVIICGIGGEGKSVLASHYISTLSEGEGRFRFWDWRDCKEQSDRVRTQITEIIVRFSHGALIADDVADADESELVDILIDHIDDEEAILVFDNVDSYVDLINKTFTGALDILVQRLSTSKSKSRIVLTCRPDVQYPSSSIITFPLKGISEDEAIELFRQRAPLQTIPEDDIRDAHGLTNGHAFWLDLLAVQITKVPGTTLRKMLDDLRRGREDAPDVLSSIWSKLALRERTLLRFMAEAVRPETEETIQRFVSSQLTYKNFSRAFKSLISLNLIVVKPEKDAPDLYDLHPLVRQFVRTRFAKAERKDFIQAAIRQYEVIIGAIGYLLNINLPFALLERWSQKAELEISANLFDDAFETLNKVEDALIGGGHLQEYVRVCRLLFESIEWETAPAKYKDFDDLVGAMIACLDQLGDRDSADSILHRYEATIPQKTARYIKFCDIQAYSLWQRGEFEGAIEWASKGVALKNETNVDTRFDCEHTLALAQRDAGHHSLALNHFLKGHELADLLNGTLEDGAGDGSMYGNVGRCLQLMNRMDEALVCYKRSMAVLEKDSSSHSKSNRAYARRWIGQTFAAEGKCELAEAFFIDAIRVLGSSAPLRVRDLYSDIKTARGATALIMSETKATLMVRRWMEG